MSVIVLKNRFLRNTSRRNQNTCFGMSEKVFITCILKKCASMKTKYGFLGDILSTINQLEFLEFLCKHTSNYTESSFFIKLQKVDKNTF